MYLTFKDRIADGELQILREFVGFLDRELSVIVRRVGESNNPEGDGLYDRAEYFIGIGFVAIQQYLYDTCSCINIDRAEAFRYGPAHDAGVTWVKIIHESANWWKHEAEWYKKGTVRDSTYSTVVGVTGTSEYPMSNVLAAFTEDHCLSFTSVISKVTEWRDILAHDKSLRPAHVGGCLSGRAGEGL